LTNKRKIFNDPLYGFVTIPSDLIFELVQHPYFQRLRRIKQLGMAELVYPGAIHSRFQHALGAMHLMSQALLTLQTKGHLIMEIEREAAQIAILLHDLGHGPFSHVLEKYILDGVHHEDISTLMMQDLNQQFNGELTLAIEMFTGKYHRKFFHQLISSQLDMDRLDYLNRDSFFTGVAEGTIGVDRIIKMLNVVDNQLVVEEKGLLSVENFLVARRLMYWQVYLHKTSICAETMLINTIKRVRELLGNNENLKIPDYLLVFFEKNITLEDFKNNPHYLQQFVLLDDIDIWASLKKWQFHPDKILSFLSSSILNRNLFKIKIGVNIEFDEKNLEVNEALKKLKISEADKKYFYLKSSISNAGYLAKHSNIKILMKNGNILDVSEASDLPTVKALGNIVKKNYFCYANDVYLRIKS
jgi:uncharacterized protein